MQLGILQFTAGTSHDVKDILSLAVEADALGFSRFWLGEHYTNIDWNNPEALLPIILGLTENIRVGPAGILLRLHAPFRIACTFKLLGAVFPDRIDLGLGAGVTANEKAIQLLTNLNTEHFRDINYRAKVEELMDFFNREAEHLEEGVIVAPIQIPAPPVWLLSTSNNSLGMALDLKANVSRSLFHQSSLQDPDKDSLDRFYEAYFKQHGVLPQVNLAFAGVCAPSKEAAQERFAQSSYATNTFILPNIIGTPEEFQETLADYQERFGIEEFIFLDMADQQEDRLWSLQALSEVCQLPATLNTSTADLQAA
ncbi:MAG: LLM class flavin-dependent oxidoreductase [Saprospiraceae bacterium]|nr:LLM class flavin-dependent oxidoreductase [Saprospiraceae bacterium]